MLVQKVNQLPKISSIPALIAIDYETVDKKNMDIEGFSFAYVKNKKIVSFYCPLADAEIEYDDSEYENLPNLFMMKYLRALVRKRGLVMHNAQFDMMVMDKNDIKYDRANCDCTMLLHYTIDTERKHGLKPIMELEYGREVVAYKEAKLMGFEVFSQYADNDARYTLFLWADLLRQCKKLPDQYKLYKDHEIPFINVLHRMNYTQNGIRVDEELLYKYVKMVEEELGMVEAVLTDKLGNINLNSTQQLAVVLEEKGYEISYTPKGNPTLSEPILQKLYNKHKGLIFEALIYYRTLQKLASTYVYPLYERLIKVGKGVYIIVDYDFFHIGARTGRLSSRNPNMQNQPRDPVVMALHFVKELQRNGLLDKGNPFLNAKAMKKLYNSKGKEIIGYKDFNSIDIRKIFIPMPGYVFIGADFSQIELRMAAHLANDKNMIELFKMEEDIHTKTAKLVSDLVGFYVDRQYAKPINFGILYGLYYKTFAKEYGIAMNKAKAMFDGWWNAYRDIYVYVKRMHKLARKTGYATTILGRKRNIIALGINDFENFRRMNYAENASISHCVSGSSADLIKTAMLNIHRKYSEVIIRLQVHDELLFEVKKKDAKKYSSIVKYEMETAMKLRCPVVADVSVGNNWREVH